MGTQKDTKPMKLLPTFELHENFMKNENISSSPHSPLRDSHDYNELHTFSQSRF